ncbi:MAG: hypothetical protein ABIG39_05250 [Candidatus Micrarchaeota archaeon]
MYSLEDPYPLKLIKKARKTRKIKPITINKKGNSNFTVFGISIPSTIPTWVWVFVGFLDAKQADHAPQAYIII